MSEQLEPKPKTNENETTETKPRYEPPQIMDLGKMAQALGGGNCGTGSAQSSSCFNGPNAGGSCSTGASGTLPPAT